MEELVENRESNTAHFILGLYLSWLEGLAHNQLVLGSSPRRPTNPRESMWVFGHIPFGNSPSLIHLLYNEGELL